MRATEKTPRSEYWHCPVEDCRFETAASDEERDDGLPPPPDQQDLLHQHLVSVHGLDQDWNASQAVWDAKWRWRNVRRLQEGRERMQGWTLDTFPAADVAGRRALRQVRDWFEDDDKWAWRVFIYGPPGTGKTGLAYGLCWRWINLGIEFPDTGADMHNWEPVLFCNMRQYLAEQQARMSAGGRTDFEPLLNAGLVILDDLGAERPTPWALDKIALTIEGRYETKGVLVVTSNYAPNELAARLGHEDPMVGQRLVSRLTDGALVIRLDRADLRHAQRGDA